MPPAWDNTRLRMMISAHERLMWCDRTQVMNGGGLTPGETATDTVYSHSDELSLINSPISPEYDLYAQNSGHPSPDEYLDSDQDKNTMGEDFNMFDNNGYKYQDLNNEIDEWLMLPSTPEMEEVTQNLPLSSEDWVCFPHSDLENKLIPDMTEQPVKKQSGNLTALIDSEEPIITNAYDPACDDAKTIIIKYDLDVAGEVEVTTEEESPTMSIDSNFGFDSEDAIDIKTDDTLFNRCTISSAINLDWPQTGTDLPRARSRRPLSKLDIRAATTTASTVTSTTPGLDIASAAALANSQLLTGIQPDTPDVLKPLLNPVGFDIVEFLLAQGDDNNNAILLPSPMEEARSLQESRGKSNLTLTELKTRREMGGERRREWRKPAIAITSTSTTSLPPSRPLRKSVEKFKQKMEEVAHAEEGDSEDDEPKSKRRRSNSSSSSRRRLTSDSDLSSVCDDAVKYRERRDRNNLSSKLSRQKRKSTQQMKQQELKDLEAKNVRLKKEFEKLESVLNRANAAWQHYLERMKRGDQK